MNRGFLGLAENQAHLVRPFHRPWAVDGEKSNRTRPTGEGSPSPHDVSHVQMVDADCIDVKVDPCVPWRIGDAEGSRVVAARTGDQGAGFPAGLKSAEWFRRGIELERPTLQVVIALSPVRPAFDNHFARMDAKFPDGVAQLAWEVGEEMKGCHHDTPNDWNEGDNSQPGRRARVQNDGMAPEILLVVSPFRDQPE